MHIFRNPIVVMVTVLAFSLAGCSSTGSLGLITKPSANNIDVLKAGRSFEELGYVSGKSCRYFLLAVAPWGNGTLSAAVNDALVDGGDAIVNVTVTNSLYSLIPIYNVFAWSCTRVFGTAIKFKSS